MSFDTFKIKPIASGVVLFEFSSIVNQVFFINEEPGIWKYRFSVSVDTVFNFENGAFCYGCFENECSGTFGNDRPAVNILSVVVDGVNYTQVSSLANLRATNESFWWDGQVIRIHFNNFDPPWCFGVVSPGVSLTVANRVSNKAGIYDGLQFEGILEALSPITMKVDPLVYKLISYGGCKATLTNVDGRYDNSTVFDFFGHEVEIRYGEEGAAYADLNLIYEGIIEDFEITERQLTFNIKDKRKRFQRKIPERVFTSTDFPNMAAKYINKPIPLRYGRARNVVCYCINDDEVAPSAYVFKWADTLYHDVLGVQEVRVNDVVVTESNEDLTEATFELSTSDYSPGDRVTADVQGYEDGLGTLIENALDVILDVLFLFADISYTSDTFDQVAWAAATLVAPDIAFSTENKLYKIEDVLEQIFNSLDGIMYVMSDGKLTFRYLHELRNPTDTVKLDEQFGELEFSFPSQGNYISSVLIGYDRDWAENEHLTYLEDADEGVLDNQYGITNRFELDTLLVDEADVITLAENLMNVYGGIFRHVRISTDKAHIELELIDDIYVVLDRAEKTWFGTQNMRVWELERDPFNGTEELVLRQMSNIEDAP